MSGIKSEPGHVQAIAAHLVCILWQEQKDQGLVYVSDTIGNLPSRSTALTGSKKKMIMHYVYRIGLDRRHRVAGRATHFRIGDDIVFCRTHAVGG